MNESNIDELSYETFNNASTGAGSSVDNMSTSSRVLTQQSVTKYKVSQKHSKSSWVWKYFITDKDGTYDICQVPIFYFEAEALCGKKFSHDGSTGNMGNHLCTKHDIYERIDEVKHYHHKNKTISINIYLIDLFISFNHTKGTK